MRAIKNLKVISLIFFLCGTIVFVGCKKDTEHEDPNSTETPTSPETPGTPEVPTDTTKKPETINKTLLLKLVNDQRAAGCNCGDSGYFAPANPVTWNDKLELAAGDHCSDMYENDFFKHAGSDGSNAGTRITRRGYNWSTWGENIASGYTSEQAVITGWINSPGHCKNIMNPKFKEMGIAKVDKYWTQIFGTP